MMSPQLREISFCSTVRIDCIQIDRPLMIKLVAGHGNTRAKPLPAKTTGAQGAAGPRATAFIKLDESEYLRAPVETCTIAQSRYC